MTAMLDAPKRGGLISRALCAFAIALSGLLAGCVTMNISLDPKPSLAALPEIKKSPLHAGIYYSAAFVDFDYRRKSGNNNVSWRIGPASVSYFDQLLARVFEKTSHVDTLAPDELAKKGVDLVVAPSVEHFDFPIGFETYTERLGIAYRVTLYTPRGIPVSSWVVYGTADHRKMFGGHIEAYMQQAGEKLVRNFERYGDSGLATIAAIQRRAPEPIDVLSLQLSARHTEPLLDANALQQLRNEGFVFVEVSAAARPATPILFRASDMRLRLKSNQIIETVPPSVLMQIAARDSASGAPIVLLGPLIGGLVTLGTEAAASSKSDKERAPLSDALFQSLFGERMLNKDKGRDGGVVFFRLPPETTADGATLIAWAVDPETGAGSQLEIPLPSNMPTR